MEAILELKPSVEQMKVFLGTFQHKAKLRSKLFEETNGFLKLLRKIIGQKWDMEEENNVNETKERLIFCLVQSGGVRDNIVTTDATDIGLGITIWRQ